MIKKLTMIIAVVFCVAGLSTTSMAADYTSSSNQSVNIRDSFINGNVNIYLYNHMSNGGTFDINENIHIDNTYINGDMQIYNYINSTDTAFESDFRGMPPTVF